ncbi:MAG TPA: TetR/AcrR family transcriptional regulator [Rhodopila sp.]|jgi:AcrR family transcriptional regulator|nr:TetR/AcrR family transcriptional regulator [Rhodopila sp.]
MAVKAEGMRPEVAAVGQRGPAEHERREQILKAADEHFRHYGYNKTTVADLAKAIGLSTAYIYKFFESKQAIGEAVCSVALGRISVDLRKIAQEPRPAADRLRLIYPRLASLSKELLFNERELHDLAANACTENWQAIHDHQAAILEIVRDIILQGREAGEFEKKTPIDEACRAIMQTLEPFWKPIFLEQNFDELEERALAVANLVLRSLAP